MTQIDTNKCKGLRPVLLVFVLEVGVLLLVTLLSMPLSQPHTLLSILLGGAIFVIPNTYFTLYAFRYRGADWTPFIVRSFLQGQMGKLALSAVAFAIVFRLYPAVNVIVLFGSYSVLVITHIVVAGYISHLNDNGWQIGSNKSERKF